MISFTVPGIPIAQPRQRHKVLPGSAYAVNFTPAKHPVNAFKAAAQLAARMAYCGPPLKGPLIARLTFVFPRPATVPKKLGAGRLLHDVKPDIDNVMKSLLDALTGLLFDNDAQIYQALVTKYRASAAEQPHVAVEIYPCPPSSQSNLSALPAA